MKDDELKQRLVQYLDHLESGIRQGGEFVASQAPEVAQQYLAYQYASNAFMATVAGLILIAALCGIGKAASLFRTADYHNMRGEAGAVVGTISAVVAFASGIAMCNTIDHLMKIHLAPKYFLLETLARLIS